MNLAERKFVAASFKQGKEKSHYDEWRLEFVLSREVILWKYTTAAVSCTVFFCFDSSFCASIELKSFQYLVVEVSTFICNPSDMVSSQQRTEMTETTWFVTRWSPLIHSRFSTGT